jgi:hypothetical protein
MSKNTLLAIIGVSLVGGAIVYYMGKDKDEDEDEDEDTKGIEKSNKDLLGYRQVSNLNDDYQKRLEAEKKEKEKEKLFERMNSNDSDVSLSSLTDKGGKKMLSNKNNKRRKGSKKSKRSKRSKRSKKRVYI